MDVDAAGEGLEPLAPHPAEYERGLAEPLAKRPRWQVALKLQRSEQVVEVLPCDHRD